MVPCSTSPSPSASPDALLTSLAFSPQSSQGEFFNAARVGVASSPPSDIPASDVLGDRNCRGIIPRTLPVYLVTTSVGHLSRSSFSHLPLLSLDVELFSSGRYMGYAWGALERPKQQNMFLLLAYYFIIELNLLTYASSSSC